MNQQNQHIIEEGVLSTDCFISELTTLCKYFNFDFILFLKQNSYFILYLLMLKFILCKLFHVKVVL